ncbi:unnamed protein product [Dicrocoelium dendriticum]|nr:unnamed protein product [Dicrocoelium dendriticum]
MPSNPISDIVCDSVSDFIESTIHTYLFQRGVYPRCAFTEFVLFGVHIQICTNPEVKVYINDCVESVRSRLRFLRELRILVCTLEKEPLESLVLRFDRISEEFVKRDTALSLLQEYFATALLRLSLLECFHDPFDFETTWELCTRFAPAETHPDNIGSVSWVPKDCIEHNDAQKLTLVPVKSFYNDHIQLQLFLEQRSRDSATVGQRSH